MEKATSTMLVVLVIGALIGAAGAYYYVQPQLTAKYDAGYAAGSAAAPAPTSTAAPEIDWSWSGTPFNLASAIDVDGNVAATVYTTKTLTIKNSGTTDIANLVLGLKDPKTSASGLDSDLVNKYFKVNLSTATITGINILDNSIYYTYSLGTLPAGATATVDVSCGALKNSKGLFTDAGTYDNILYAYTSGSLAEEIDFTVTT
jgi:hypothetical protein